MTSETCVPRNGTSAKVVFLSVQSSDAKVMESSMERLRKEEGLPIDSLCLNSEEPDDDPVKYQELVRRTESADLVFIRCMAEPSKFKRFEKYERTLRAVRGYVMIYSGNLDVTLLYRDLFKGTDEDFVLLRTYALHRGAENDRGIMCWIAKKKGLFRGELPEPVKQRREGIYHPDFGRDVTLEEYRKALDPDKLTIGIMFTGNQWIYDNLDHIDALVREVESGGMNAVPVFFSAVSAAVEGEKGTVEVVREYMTDGGKPFVDAIIICTSFSQLVNSRKTAGVGTRDEENYYRYLTNVPIIHAMSVSGDYHDYEDDAVGLSKNDIVMHAAWPEVDGQIIAVPISHTPGKNAGSRRLVPIPDRIGHIVELARNWAVLRRTPPAERRIAILLYQSRPSSGNIGGAAGLDSLESVYEMLKRMSEVGYTIENVPGSGKELIEEILDGVTNDLNETPPRAVREKAADLIDAGTYREQFDTIPEYDRKMMISSWGDPPGQICVEGKEIIIPGIVKGNVFIGYQPMRGYTDHMEAIYHDPLLFAQHQYLAYYRWIKDMFKANVVVHVGTHGTLEWLPGKNVGLSRKCDPDVVLGALPNLYPYIIDDPGEGIQTKRRSESVVIGHLNPTMSRAGTYDELAEVEVPL